MKRYVSLFERLKQSEVQPIDLKKAKEFEKQFNRLAKNKAKIDLVGSILTKGYSEHDADYILTILNYNWFDDLVETIDDEGQYPYLTIFTDRMKASMVEWGDYENGSEVVSFEWENHIIDIFIREEI